MFSAVKDQTAACGNKINSSFKSCSQARKDSSTGRYKTVVTVNVLIRPGHRNLED